MDTTTKSIEKLRRLGLNALVREGAKTEDGEREVSGRLKKAGDGRYRLYVHRSCVNLISDLQIYSVENQRKGILHAYDGLRYALSVPKKSPPAILLK